MINKPFDLVEKADIDALVTNEVREGRALDYKEKLPGNSDSEKSEFLADVSSFANASGGYILYGVREKRDTEGKPTSIPESADGLEGANADSEILRLESSIRTGIDPRVPGVRSKAIEGFPKGPVLIMWVPKSWSSPHMVTFKNHSRFYSRSSNGKYALDVTEIRSAFALSESLPERVRRFRDDRLAKIVADETPVPLEKCPKVVLHLLPVSSLNVETSVDASTMWQEKGRTAPISPGGWSHRYNFDGLVTFAYHSSPDMSYSYVQTFRNGAIEAVDADLLCESEGKKLIPSVAYEKDLISAVDRYLKLQEVFSLNPPVFIMITLLNVKNYTMAVKPSYRSYRLSPIDRDVLLLPEILVEEYGPDAVAILHPAFDVVWQAAGWERSMNYDKDGKWVGQ